MKLLRLDSIKVPEYRQRKDFDEKYIGELMGSITADGLINPIVVRKTDEGYTLVAGECRLRAITLASKLGMVIKYAGYEIPLGVIPAVDFGALTPLQQQEIEYAENAVRKDLSWQENLQALESLHLLRKAQAGARGENQTPRETAREVASGQSEAQVSRITDQIRLAARLDDPEISKASSLKEALKIARRQDDTARREVLAKTVGTVAISDRFKCFNAEATEWVKGQASEQFDCILTDPPYGMDADQFGDAAGKMAGINHDYSDSEVYFKTLMSALVPEYYRVAKPEAHMYLWCDVEHFVWLRDLCREAGWWVFRTPLINIKPEGGRVPWPEHGPRRSYELCLYANKGKKPVSAIKPDVFESRLTEGNLGHGAQKPVEAYVELLKRSVRPGDVVLDTFAGTGTIFPAAHLVGAKAVGVELAPAAYGICLERIGALK